MRLATVVSLDQIAAKLLDSFGEKRAHYALGIAGLVCALPLNNNVRKNRKWQTRRVIFVQLSSNNRAIVANGSALCNINPFTAAIVAGERLANRLIAKRDLKLFKERVSTPNK